MMYWSIFIWQFIEDYSFPKKWQKHSFSIVTESFNLINAAGLYQKKSENQNIFCF